MIRTGYRDSAVTEYDQTPGRSIQDTYYGAFKKANHSSPNHMLPFAELQTISVTSAIQIWPVRRLSEKGVAAFTRGGRTFAGTMVFAVIDKDVLYEAFDLYNIRPRADRYYIDQLPEFDVVISATNEYGDTAVQIITGITISHTGTTYSIDDLYTESTMTYLARHVTPFIKLIDKENDIIGHGHNGLIRPKINQQFSHGDLQSMINPLHGNIRVPNSIFGIPSAARAIQQSVIRSVQSATQ